MLALPCYLANKVFSHLSYMSCISPCQYSRNAARCEVKAKKVVPSSSCPLAENACASASPMCVAADTAAPSDARAAACKACVAPGLAKRARRHLLRVRRRVYRACCCLPRAWRRRGEEVRVRGECRRCLGYAAGLCKRADNVQARCSGVASALDTAGGGAARQSECAAGWAGSQKQAFKKWSPDIRL
jgi:hypothetical protein